MAAQVVPALVLQLLHHLVHGTLQPCLHGNADLSQQIQTSLRFHFHHLHDQEKTETCQTNIPAVTKGFQHQIFSFSYLIFIGTFQINPF